MMIKNVNMLYLILLIRRLKEYPMTNGFVPTVAELKAVKEKNKSFVNHVVSYIINIFLFMKRIYKDNILVND